MKLVEFGKSWSFNLVNFLNFTKRTFLTTVKFFKTTITEWSFITGIKMVSRYKARVILDVCRNLFKGTCIIKYVKRNKSGVHLLVLPFYFRHRY